MLSYSMSESQTDAPKAELTPSPAPEQPRGGGGWWKAFAIVAVTALLCFTGLAVYVGMSLKEAFTQPGKLLSGFFSSEVKQSASNVLLEIQRTHGDILEVASPTTTMETFTKADSRMAAWGKIYLGTTITEIKVPATYRFHVKLSEMKDARVDGNVLIITAPDIRPSLPVAFDTAGIERKSDSGWARFNGAEQLADMEKNITAGLNERAVKQAEVVRETARKDIEEFVQRWIVDNNPGLRDQIRAIKVLFPGEKADKVKSETLLP
jgi:hypothetical protein